MGLARALSAQLLQGIDTLKLMTSRYSSRRALVWVLYPQSSLLVKIYTAQIFSIPDTAREGSCSRASSDWTGGRTEQSQQQVSPPTSGAA